MWPQQVGTAAHPSPGPLLPHQPGHQFSLCYSCGLTPSGICHLSEASLTTLPEHTLPFILSLSAHPPPRQIIALRQQECSVLVAPFSSASRRGPSTEQVLKTSVVQTNDCPEKDKKQTQRQARGPTSVIPARKKTDYNCQTHGLTPIIPSMVGGQGRRIV